MHKSMIISLKKNFMYFIAKILQKRVESEEYRELCQDGLRIIPSLLNNSIYKLEKIMLSLLT